MQAAEIMSKYVLTCSKDTTIHELIRLFVRNKVTAIPVVGDDNELLGIISEGDLLYKKVRPYRNTSMFWEPAFTTAATDNMKKHFKNCWRRAPKKS